MELHYHTKLIAFTLDYCLPAVAPCLFVSCCMAVPEYMGSFLAFPSSGKTLSSTYCPCFFSLKSISSIVDDIISVVVSKNRLRGNAVKACFGVRLLIQQSGMRFFTLDLDVYHLLFYSIGLGALLHTVPITPILSIVQVEYVLGADILSVIYSKVEFVIGNGCNSIYLSQWALTIIVDR